MNLSEISIRRPVFAWMLMAALIVFGGISFSRMGVSQLPDVDFPVVSIGLNLEGAAPEVMELDVVDIVEDAVMGIQGIRSLSSTSKTGKASITIEFGLEKNIDTAVQEIQNILSQAARRLPRDMDPPTVTKTNPEDQPILWLAFSSDKMTDQELMVYVRDRVKDSFSTIQGVGEVFLGGYVDPNLRVWLSAKKLNQYELAVTDVLNTISQEHAELPAGRLETGKQEFNIRTLGEAPTPKDFGDLTINRRGGEPNYTPIYLKQVTRIEDGLADIRRRSRSMGKPAIGLGIRKQRGSNAVEVARAVKAKLAEVSTTLPAGAELGVRFDNTRFIEESIHELNFTLVLSALLTALVCWLFIGSWTATLNIIMAIPTSIVGTFMALYWLGFTLNTFTLLGLSLAIGIVVDDAIMVLENIVRHREMGKKKFLAALDGSREITFAALAATAAIIAIFLPVAFMKGIIGKFFLQFGVTLSVAVALSLLEALTLTPMRCSQFLDVGKRKTRLGKAVEYAFTAGASTYKRALEYVLRYRYTTVAVSLGLFVLSLLLLGPLRKEFVPAQDQGSLFVRITTPVGSSLAYTDNKLKKVEEYVLKRPEIDKYFSTVGGFGGGDVNSGMLFLTLKPKHLRPINPKTGRRLSQQELADIYRADLKKIPDIKVGIQDSSLSGFSSKRGFPIEFTIRGPNWDHLVKASEGITQKMEASGLMTDIDSDYLTGMPEVQVIPDRARARRFGVSIYDVGQSINAAMGGVIAGKYSKDGHRSDVRVRLEETERTKAEDILTLKIRNNRGELIPMSSVVKLQTKRSLQAIARQDRERAISISANMAKGVSQAQAMQEVEKIGIASLEPGYRVVMSGSSQSFQESKDSFLMALLLGLIVSYMVLASQFNSFVDPFTVLMALPFSISGAIVALLLGNQSLNIYSMIGLILLMGIVKKNSILLVDFTNQVRQKGKSVKESLLEACPARLRPILMTSIATVVGAIPAAFAIGPGSESRIPMALAVIGGVVVSTLLTLLVIPCVYSLLPKSKSPDGVNQPG